MHPSLLYIVSCGNLSQHAFVSTDLKIVTAYATLLLLSFALFSRSGMSMHAQTPFHHHLNVPHGISASAAGARMTKGLHICRHLHKAGWRVVLVDYDRWWMQGSRLSSCCAAFHTVPDPEQNPIGEASHGSRDLGCNLLYSLGTQSVTQGCCTCCSHNE